MMPLILTSALLALIGSVSRHPPSFGSHATSSTKPTLTTPLLLPAVATHSLMSASKGFLLASFITFIPLLKISVNTCLPDALLRQNLCSAHLLFLWPCSLQETPPLLPFFSRRLIGMGGTKCIRPGAFVESVGSRYCGGSRHLNMISVRTHCSPVFRPGIGGRGGGNAGTGLAMLWSVVCSLPLKLCHVCIWLQITVWMAGVQGTRWGGMGDESRKVVWKSYIVSVQVQCLQHNISPHMFVDCLAFTCNVTSLIRPFDTCCVIVQLKTWSSVGMEF